MKRLRRLLMHLVVGFVMGAGLAIVITGVCLLTEWP